MAGGELRYNRARWTVRLPDHRGWPGFFYVPLPQEGITEYRERAEAGENRQSLCFPEQQAAHVARDRYETTPPQQVGAPKIATPGSLGDAVNRSQRLDNHRARSSRK